MKTSASEYGSSSDWRVISEMFPSKYTTRPDGTPEMVEFQYVRRSDGAEIRRTSMGGREFNEGYKFVGSLGEFSFVAQRWNEEEQKPSDRYIVKLFYPFLEKGKERLAYSVAKDIEAALLAYPPVIPDFKTVPLKEILFQTTVGYSPTTLKHAEEM